VDRHVLLTDEESAEDLAPLAERGGFELFTGPREDVLERFALAVERYGVETFLRATGDNPLVSAGCAGALLELHLLKGADYSGYRGLPLGTGVECVRGAALLEARRRAVRPYDREHVCPYLYTHPESFAIFTPEAPEKCRAPELRVTLDTAEDYERLKLIFSRLYRGKPIQTAELVGTFGRSPAVSR
jgi:spore coat polysaccharide biosynthesis protein SpsF